MSSLVSCKIKYLPLCIYKFTHTCTGTDIRTQAISIDVRLLPPHDVMFLQPPPPFSVPVLHQTIHYHHPVLHPTEPQAKTRTKSTRRLTKSNCRQVSFLVTRRYGQRFRGLINLSAVPAGRGNLQQTGELRLFA